MNMTSSSSKPPKMRRKPLSLRNSRSISSRRLCQALLQRHDFQAFALRELANSRYRSRISCHRLLLGI